MILNILDWYKYKTHEHMILHQSDIQILKENEMGPGHPGHYVNHLCKEYNSNNNGIMLQYKS